MCMRAYFGPMSAQERPVRLLDAATSAGLIVCIEDVSREGYEELSEQHHGGGYGVRFANFERKGRYFLVLIPT